MTDRVNVIDTIAKQDMFSTFTRLLKSSKAEEILSGDGSFTVFVPTNDAFGKVPDPQMAELLGETDQVRLKALLTYHMVPAKLFAANLGSAGRTKSVSGQEITFSDAGGIKVNASGLQARNIEATNGVVHAIDTVLTLPVATETTVAAAATATATAPVIAPAPAAETTAAPAIAPSPAVATAPASKLL